MRRDFILIVGNQGCGKSVWAKSYAAAHDRLLVFDPMGSYSRVDFMTDTDEWAEEVANARLNVFRYGRIMPDDLDILGNVAMGAGNCTLVIEECAIIFERGEKLADWMKRLVFMGRHQSVNLVLIAQRAAKVPIDIRSQASRLITFKQTEPNDVAAVAERVGGDVYDEIFTLPELHCIDWENGETRRYAVRP
jgi:hypothetical protein